MEVRRFKSVAGEHYALVVYVFVLAIVVQQHALGGAGLKPVSPETEENVICASKREMARIVVQYSKGQVNHRSNEYVATVSRKTQFTHGDQLTTGSNGFVSVLLAQGRIRNIQPHSRVIFRELADCRNLIARPRKSFTLDIPFLTAAVRG